MMMKMIGAMKFAEECKFDNVGQQIVLTEGVALTEELHYKAAQGSGSKLRSESQSWTYWRSFAANFLLKVSGIW